MQKMDLENLNREEPLLSIRFGRYEDDIFDIDGTFDICDYLPWLEDPFILKIITDIENCEHVSGSVFTGEFGDFGPKQFSTGTKALILMDKYPELIMDATRCGDNCAKWILEISKRHSITITLRYPMELEGIAKFYCINSQQMRSGFGDYVLEYSNWRELEVMNYE